VRKAFAKRSSSTFLTIGSNSLAYLSTKGKNILRYATLGTSYELIEISGKIPNPMLQKNQFHSLSRKAFPLPSTIEEHQVD
jgi:hypothetical protein